MRKRMVLPALALCMTAMLTVPASALEYTIETDKAPNFGMPTSISNCNPAQRLQFEKEEQGSEWSFRRQAEAELSGLCDDVVETVITPDGGKMKNEDLSKNAAIIPPGFGTPSSNTLNTGEYLTPNLVAGQMAQGGISGSNSAVVTPPSISGSGSTTASQGTQSSTQNSGQSVVQGGVAYPTTSFTNVTSNLYYSGGYLGTLKIPKLGVNVKVYQGTSNSILAKGAGHFEETSIWAGNVAIAGHNRGVNCYFGNIHTLNVGDKVTLTTKLGTRTYAVSSVSKISETDRSGLTATSGNQITLYTCVRNQSAYRWRVVAAEV